MGFGECELMVEYGMSPLAVLQADLINGARWHEWDGQIGALKPGYFADLIAAPGDPTMDFRVLKRVSFVSPVPEVSTHLSLLALLLLLPYLSFAWPL